MKRKALLLILGCLLLTSTAVAQAKPEAKKPVGAVAANTSVPDKTLMQKIMEAWQSMKLDNPAKYYDKSATNIFYDAAPLKYVGWPEYAKGSKAMFDTLESLKITLNDDAMVHHSGNLAWGTATVHMVMTAKGGQPKPVDGRWTVVWEKKGPDWLIVHEHFSAPMPEPK